MDPGPSSSRCPSSTDALQICSNTNLVITLELIGEASGVWPQGGEMKQGPVRRWSFRRGRAGGAVGPGASGPTSSSAP